MAHIKHDKLEQGNFFSTVIKQSEEKSLVEQYRRKSGVSTIHWAEELTKLRDHKCINENTKWARLCLNCIKIKRLQLLHFGKTLNTLTIGGTATSSTTSRLPVECQTFTQWTKWKMKTNIFRLYLSFQGPQSPQVVQRTGLAGIVSR